VFKREAMRANIQRLKDEVIAAAPFTPSEMEAGYNYLNDTSGPVPKSKVKSRPGTVDMIF
jgi:hypothetical protein